MDPLLKTYPVVFSNFYVLFVVLFLLNQSGDSIEVNNPDSAYLTNVSYGYENLRRYTRQANQRCQVPSNPPHTIYNIIVGDRGTKYAQNNNVLEILCDKEYKQSPFESIISICRNGKWTPPLTNCLRTCPSLSSITSTSIHCKWNDPNGDTIPLQNCINPVAGTVVFLSCNSFYEEPYVNKNPVHVCTTEGKWDPAISACYPICGLKRPKAHNNIVNGTDTTPGDYPWQVGVYNRKQELICGGSILDTRVVLSAAHCFTDYDGNVKPTVDYFITSGKYYRNYNDARDQSAQFSRVLNIHVPTRYKGVVNLQGFDIAIIILADPFKISLTVQPVCIELNEESQYLHLSINKIGIVTGWGYTQNGQLKLSDVLKEVAIPYIPYDECFAAVPYNFRRYITHDKICGGYINNGTSVCGGDSGGGLVFKKLNSDQHYIKGIVSQSPATEEGFCDTNQYSVYTAVGKHIDFVRKHLLFNQNRQNIECAQEDCSNDTPEIIPTEEYTTQRYTTERRTTERRTTEQYTTKIVKRTCTLPNFPLNGKYILNQNDPYRPGSQVQQNSLLTVTCNAGFELSVASSNQAYCTDTGGWSSSLSTCTREVLSCVTPNNERAVCKPISECGVIQAALLSGSSEATSFAQKSVCGNSIDQLVCCGSSGFPPVQLAQNRLLPSLDECGIQTIQDNEVDGEAQVKEFPWLALVAQVDQRSSREVTGKGCLISKRYVLTSAFLVARYQYSATNGLSSVRLGIDEYSLSQPCRTPRSCGSHVISVGVEAIIVHPSYSTELRVADIALVRLNRNVEFTDHIRPACLPTSTYTVPTGSSLWLAGWAKIQSNNGLESKVKGKLSARSAAECSLQGVDFTRTFCAATNADFAKRELCNGNLAGPGFGRIHNPAKNQFQWAQVGITTFSYNIICDSSRYRGYYTSVSEYTDWIISNLS